MGGGQAELMQRPETSAPCFWAAVQIAGEVALGPALD
jgi:hypothetical protein